MLGYDIYVQRNFLFRELGYYLHIVQLSVMFFLFIVRITYILITQKVCTDKQTCLSNYIFSFNCSSSFLYQFFIYMDVSRLIDFSSLRLSLHYRYPLSTVFVRRTVFHPLIQPRARGGFSAGYEDREEGGKAKGKEGAHTVGWHGVQDVRRRRRGLGIDPEPPLSCLKVRPWLLRSVLSPPSTSCKKPARNEYS